MLFCSFYFGCFVFACRKYFSFKMFSSALLGSFLKQFFYVCSFKCFILFSKKFLVIIFSFHFLHSFIYFIICSESFLKKTEANNVETIYESWISWICLSHPSFLRSIWVYTWSLNIVFLLNVVCSEFFWILFLDWLVCF